MITKNYIANEECLNPLLTLHLHSIYDKRVFESPLNIISILMSDTVVIIESHLSII